MKIDKHKKALKNIKIRYPLLFPCECEKCGEEYVREKMYMTISDNKYYFKYNYYCIHCFSTKEDVLEYTNKPSIIPPPRRY
jgi:hypothetical protein